MANFGDYEPKRSRDSLDNRRKLFHKLSGCTVTINYYHWKSYGEIRSPGTNGQGTPENEDDVPAPEVEFSIEIEEVGEGTYETNYDRATIEGDDGVDPDHLGWLDARASIDLTSIVIPGEHSAKVEFRPWGSYVENRTITTKGAERDGPDGNWSETSDTVTDDPEETEGYLYHPSVIPGYIRRVLESITETTEEDGKGSRGDRKWEIYLFDIEELEPDGGFQEPGWSHTQTPVDVHNESGTIGEGTWEHEIETLEVTITLT